MTRRTFVAAAAAAVSTAVISAQASGKAVNADEARVPARFEEIGTAPDLIWNGAVYTAGRVFASIPGWLGPTPGVVVMHEEGSYSSFPGGTWNQWGEGRNPLEHFVDVNSIFADGRGSLWVVDAAAPGFGKGIPGAAKLVQIDLSTDKVVRTIPFDGKTMGDGQRFGHLRIHGDHGFLTESKTGAFVIVNLLDGSYRKVLSGHPLMRCEPDDVPVIEGRPLQRNGKPAYIHNDLLEISPDGKTLYFCCLFGRKMFQVPLSVLKDERASDDQIVAAVSVAFVLDGPWIAGMCRDPEGNLYLTDAEKNAVHSRRLDGHVRLLATDPQLVWPIAPSIAPDGTLYVTATQLNRVAMFADGVDKVKRPWKMFKLIAADSLG